MCNRLEAEYNARLAEEAKPPEFDPTPQRIVEAMVAVAAPAKGEVVYDLGCGDGRVLVEAASKFGCKAVGIEIDPRIVEIARKKISKQKLTKRIQLIEGDIREFEMDKADVVFIYQLPELVAEVKDEMLKARRMVVSYSHPIPGVRNEEYKVDGADPFYVWRRPVAATWW